MKLKNILLSCILIFGLSEVVYSQKRDGAVMLYAWPGSQVDSTKLPKQISKFEEFTIWRWGYDRVRDPLDPTPTSIFSEIGGPPKYSSEGHFIQWTANEDTNFVSYRFLESMSVDMSNPTIDSIITEPVNEVWGCSEVTGYDNDGDLVWWEEGCKGKYKIEVKDDHITKLWGNPSKYYQVIVKNSLGRITPSEIIKW